MLHGWLLAQSGKAADAVSVATLASATMRSTGATAYAPWYLTYLAEAHASLGQFDEAWRCIAEATSASEITKEKWCEADIQRTAGEIELMSPAPHAGKAEAHFQHALSVAREQQARSFELRAAISLAGLWHDQGQPSKARDLLAPVYASFTEGFDTPDLKQAAAMLAELAP
jgi:predicted ATPase